MRRQSAQAWRGAEMTVVSETRQPVSRQSHHPPARQLTRERDPEIIAAVAVVPREGPQWGREESAEKPSLPGCGGADNEPARGPLS